MAEQTFRSPGFFEQEIDLSARSVTPTGTPAGVVGTAEQGPAFVPVIVGSFSDFETKFGTLDTNHPGVYNLFNNMYFNFSNCLQFCKVLQITMTALPGPRAATVCRGRVYCQTPGVSKRSILFEKYTCGLGRWPGSEV